jgi:ribosome-binding protein aMBF1 (putative translation factor)
MLGAFTAFAYSATKRLATMSEPLVTPEQVKAARRLLGWTRARLAARANTHEGVFRRYEDGGGIAPTLYLMAVREIFESARRDLR